MSEVPLEVRAELWRRGVLHWKLHAGQQILYKLFHSTPGELISYWNCARRFGKTFCLAILGFEHCLTVPNARCFFLMPFGSDATDVLRDINAQILVDCPADVLPEYKVAERRFVFKNGSELIIRGVNSEQANNRRGARATLVLADESALWDACLYTVRSVLMPMLLTTGGRIILATTPPRSPTHEIVTLRNECQASGTYTKLTIYQNPMVTPEQIAQFCKAAGGENSTDWKREYLCKFVGDENSLVIPDFTEEAKLELIRPYQRPAFFRPVVVGDPGMVDRTGILFGYADFLEQNLVIEDELLLNKANTRTIAEKVKAKETELGYRDAFRFFDDPGKRLTADLTDLGLQAFPAIKDKREVSISLLRSLISGRKFFIEPRCTKLIEQLESAIYDTAKKNMAKEGQDQGHFDLVAAAWYFARAFDTQLRHSNPYPRGWNVTRHPVFGGTPDSKALSNRGLRPAGAALAERIFGSTAAGRKVLKGRK